MPDGNLVLGGCDPLVQRIGLIEQAAGRGKPDSLAAPSAPPVQRLANRGARRPAAAGLAARAAGSVSSPHGDTERTRTKSSFTTL